MTLVLQFIRTPLYDTQMIHRMLCGNRSCPTSTFVYHFQVATSIHFHGLELVFFFSSFFNHLVHRVNGSRLKIRVSTIGLLWDLNFQQNVNYTSFSLDTIIFDFYFRRRWGATGKTLWFLLSVKLSLTSAAFNLIDC